MTTYSINTKLFCIVDDFCKEYNQLIDKHLLGSPAKPSSVMCKSKIITIMINFLIDGFRTFKHFYLYYLQKHMQK